MYGSLSGNILGILYFFVYQIVGILFAGSFLHKEKKEFQLLMGSIVGSVAFHWFPTLVALVNDFNITSHMIGLLIFILLMLVVRTRTLKQTVFGPELQAGDGIVGSIKIMLHRIRKEPVFWIGMVILFVFYYLLVSSHSIPMGENGEIRTGQCGYGDMNMHLGFITSIANQQVFPPDYSIMPGVKLAYPFLCDSNSSSIYIFGSSLRVAYMLPMLVAFFQVMLGVYCLGKVFLKNKAKAMLAWILFFLNGGFGFVYFLDMVKQDKTVFTRIFTGFYETPTNLVDNGVYWVNTIADMLLPQRATLFGWAILFGTVALLYRAIEEKNTRYFVLAGILGGALPLIHTHSFLALAFICVAWVTGYMYELTGGSMDGTNTVAKYVIPGFLVLFSILQFVQGFQDNIETYGMVLMLCVVAVAVVIVFYYMVKVIQQGDFNKLLKTWGIFLIIVLVLSLPQLINWTFQQVGDSGTLRGHFNWSNEKDLYIWFYMKNIGIVAIVGIPALIYARKRKFFMAAPALLIWPVIELAVFQRNVYDNNKLLFIAYALVCYLVADVLWKSFVRLHAYKKKGSIALAAVVVFLATFSGILTLGREYVSGEEYELYSSNQVELCEWIEKNVATDATFLTNNRHNNAVASLTGRNIVCGSGTFLYYHGLDTTEREADLNIMYTTPTVSGELFEKYGVDYILVGPDERSSYGVDELGIQSIADCVFSINDVQLYQLR